MKVLRGFTLDGTQVAQGTTDKDGKVSINGLSYGSYMIIATGELVRNNSVTVDLQEANNNPRAIVMSPAQDKNDMRVIAVMGEPNADFDLLVQMRSDKGGQCTVSAINKYCPYAAHINDVKFGTGEEQIVIKKLAVANYLAFVQPAPAYSSSCAYSNDYETNLKKYHYQGWNWNSFKTTNPLNTLKIFTNTYGSQFTSVLDKFSQAIYLLKVPETVETQDEADKPHRVIALNGNPISYELIIKTLFDRVTNKSNPNSGFVYSNTSSANSTNTSSQTNTSTQNNSTSANQSTPNTSTNTTTNNTNTTSNTSNTTANTTTNTTSNTSNTTSNTTTNTTSNTSNTTSNTTINTTNTTNTTSNTTNTTDNTTINTTTDNTTINTTNTTSNNSSNTSNTSTTNTTENQTNTTANTSTNTTNTSINTTNNTDSN